MSLSVHSSMERAPKVMDPKKEAELRDLARQFEGVLMNVLFKEMRNGVESSGLLQDSGQAQSTFQQLLDQNILDQAAQSGRGFGLAEKLMEQWKGQMLPKAGRYS